MKRKYVVCLLAILIIPVLFAQGFAFVEWNIHKTLKLDTQPLDVAVSKNGNSIFVLTKSGKILIYSSDGKLKDKIDVGNHVDQIKSGPGEEWLFLSSRKNKTVGILHVDFIQHMRYLRVTISRCGKRSGSDRCFQRFPMTVLREDCISTGAGARE